MNADSQQETGPKGDKPEESKSISLTLIPPQNGAFSAVYSEYLSDPLLKTKMTKRMQVDNPELLMFFRADPHLPNSNLAIHFSTLYYRMFEKGALKLGLSPLRVEKDTLYSVYRPVNSRLSRELEKGLNAPAVKDIRSDFEKRKAWDRNFSPELGAFWDYVESYTKHEKQKGANDFASFMNLMLVYGLQMVLQEQHNKNPLANTRSESPN